MPQPPTPGDARSIQRTQSFFLNGGARSERAEGGVDAMVELARAEMALRLALGAAAAAAALAGVATSRGTGTASPSLSGRLSSALAAFLGNSSSSSPAAAAAAAVGGRAGEPMTKEELLALLSKLNIKYELVEHAGACGLHPQSRPAGQCDRRPRRNPGLQSPRRSIACWPTVARPRQRTPAQGC